MKKTLLIAAYLIISAIIMAVFVVKAANASPVPKESARTSVEAQIRDAWKAAGTLEELRLVVIVLGDSKEAKQLFPKGNAHLPALLIPREVYCTEKACRQSVQYLGKVRRDEFTFAVFRLVNVEERVA